MAKMSGLGKGLDALFGGANVVEEKVTAASTSESNTNSDGIVRLKLVDIEPNPEQARKIFDEESIDELAESIKTYGVIQPIIVTKKEKYYEIIAGERRWRASKRAGLEDIPVIIREDDTKRNMEISLIENIQREDLNPIEKARGIKMLIDEYDLTQQKVADILGKSRSSIANTVRILNLDERVIELALQGKLTEGHCKALMAIDDNEKQYQMALRMIESGDSVREAEKKMHIKKRMKKKDEKYEAIYRDIETSFRGFFGTKVKLDAGAKKGKIIIQYSSNEDLERILQLIK
ncbi:MAG: ParB/RepB/Spo0J family partition protein [Clostridia bacterium]|nr:ParB/RepB/Spo0J family partition protein [Clostridia bacterium]